MRIKWFIFLFVFMGSLVANAQRNSYALKKIAPADQQADMNLLKKILEANHPSLYWYTTKTQLDSAFNNIYSQLTDSINEIDFRNKVAQWVGLINCGHTTVQHSKLLSKQMQANKIPLFPLQIKAWDDSLVVLANFNRNDSLLKRGTIIQSINGIQNRFLLDSMFKGISTDGYSINHKNQVVSNSFPFWYANTFGTDTAYCIEYIDSTGKSQTTSIAQFTIDTSTANRVVPIRTAENRPVKISKRQLRLLSRRSLLIDTANHTAYMRLNTFSRGSLKCFFRKSFRTIKKEGVTNLVIDLRNNGGGKVDNSIRLTQYLVDHPFKIGDSVVAISRRFKYGSYIHPTWIYWIAMNIAASKAKDGSIHYRRYEKHYFKPRSSNHFNGTTYLVQGGYTFSASTMFIATLKGQKNITTVGEETGGGYYGNSAMHIPTIVLPNTKLRIGLPMYRLVMDSTRAKGRGIMPNIVVPPSSAAIKAGADLKMAVIKGLIAVKSINK